MTVSNRKSNLKVLYSCCAFGDLQIQPVQSFKDVGANTSAITLVRLETLAEKYKL